MGQVQLLSHFGQALVEGLDITVQGWEQRKALTTYRKVLLVPEMQVLVTYLVGSRELGLTMLNDDGERTA